MSGVRRRRCAGGRFDAEFPKRLADFRVFPKNSGYPRVAAYGADHRRARFFNAFLAPFLTPLFAPFPAPFLIGFSEPPPSFLYECKHGFAFLDRLALRIAESCRLLVVAVALVRQLNAAFPKRLADFRIIPQKRGYPRV